MRQNRSYDVMTTITEYFLNCAQLSRRQRAADDTAFVLQLQIQNSEGLKMVLLSEETAAFWRQM